MNSEKTFRITVLGGPKDCAWLQSVVLWLGEFASQNRLRLKVRVSDGVFPILARTPANCWCLVETVDERDHLRRFKEARRQTLEAMDAPDGLWEISHDGFDLLRILVDADGFVIFPGGQRLTCDVVNVLFHTNNTNGTRPRMVFLGWDRASVYGLFQLLDQRMDEGWVRVTGPEQAESAFQFLTQGLGAAVAKV